jgi:carbonic anhydrase
MNKNMKIGLGVVAAALLLWWLFGGGCCCCCGKKAPLTAADAALRQLQQGNQRYADDHAKHPNAGEKRRHETAEKGQRPFATILSCSDSRVPVETVFDQGVGDVFVVRVAGAVGGPSETATIEYGVDHLGTPLLVVLGHTQCGAVTAAATHAELHGHLAELAARIAPAVNAAALAHPELKGRDLVPFAIEANVWQSLADLFAASRVTRERVAAGRLAAVGAIYDIATGKVKWLGPHPQQAALVGAPPPAAPAH